MRADAPSPSCRVSPRGRMGVALVPYTAPYPGQLSGHVLARPLVCVRPPPPADGCYKMNADVTAVSDGVGWRLPRRPQISDCKLWTILQWLN